MEGNFEIHYNLVAFFFSIEASLICPLGPAMYFLEFRPYNSVAVYGPDQINADDDEVLGTKMTKIL